MDNFTFYNPTEVIFGKNSIPQIGEAVKGRLCKKVLFLAGGGSIKKNGVYDQVMASLKDAEVDCVELWGIRVNPILEKVREAIAMAKQEKVDAILGVGGGSVIDSAKAVAAGCLMDDVWTAFGGEPVVKKALPIFAVLTLSATGTEMNQFAVVTNEDEMKKWPLAGPALYPTVSIVDPTIQQSLPPVQTAYGGIDAMAHIMESHFMGTRQETTISINEGLMRSIIKCVDHLQKEPSDYDNRANLAWATTLALNGLSGVGMNGGDWATHFIEHSVSAFHPDVAHAAGLAVLFPAWILHVKEQNREGFVRWAKEVWRGDSIEQGVSTMKAKFNQWGVATSLSELGIKESEIEPIADNALLMGTLGQLKPLSREDIVAILKLAL